jgi:hypothetical protein
MASLSQLGIQVGYTAYPSLPTADCDSEPELYSTEYGAERQHVYLPLKTDEIRLLVLNAGATEDPIECYLEHCSVGRAKRFLALSYMWGNAQNPMSIQLDGAPFQVTHNLGAFLTTYRKEHESFVLWIDALCINQADMAERQEQIQLMKRVYEGADSIVIWLGDAIPSTPTAFDCIRHIFRNWWLPRLKREHYLHGALMSITAADATEMLPVGPRQGHDEDAEASAKAKWTAIQDIFKRPWWTRIWVYQEATAPTRRGSLVFCGQHSISFNMVLVVNRIMCHLASRGNQLTQHQHLLNNTPVFMQIYLELRRRYQQLGSSHFLKLADLLSTLREFDATNARDKLYALIPTSLDGIEILDVIYSLPVEEVYTNSAWAFIQKYRNLDILGHCSAPSHNAPSLFDLPSWVPDWTAKSTPTHFFKRAILGRPNLDAASDGVDIGQDVEIGKMYNAAKDSAACSERDATGRKLKCAGVAFDQVRLVSPSAGKVPNGTDVPHDWVSWLRGIEPAPLNSAEEALSHVIVADCYRNAVNIGTRGCRASLLPDAETPSMANSTSYGMDVTGPHPATYRRRLVLTDKNYLGLTAERVERGDQVVILMGGQLPFILHKVDDHYMLIGEAYVHGIMDGEALIDQAKTEEFEIW